MYREMKVTLHENCEQKLLEKVHNDCVKDKNQSYICFRVRLVP